MKIATWNVNGLKARLDFLKIWLEQRQPDVVGLQELKLVDESFPHAEIEALGYRAVTHGQKSWNGVAVLSRLPMEALQIGLPGQADFGSRLLTVRVD
ncbi:MAG: endonuclease/exonuclease/phosphatase family protein, partial [Pseudomonadales bacterium]